MSASSWICKFGECVTCGDIVIVTQATERFCDYWYYCADKLCINHKGEQVDDQTTPDMIKRVTGA